MMKRIALAAVACLLAVAAYAGTGDASFPLYMRPGHVGPLGYCQTTVALSVVSLTTACSGGVPKGATYALVCNESADAVRYRDDIGVNGNTGIPTSTVGQILGAGTALVPNCSAVSTTLTSLRLIAETSSAVLDITFYQ